MKLNKQWHASNKMPKNASLEQRIRWHMAHEKNCSCRPIPKKLKAIIKKKKLKCSQTNLK
jgi:hypothetical protein